MPKPDCFDIGFGRKSTQGHIQEQVGAQGTYDYRTGSFEGSGLKRHATLCVSRVRIILSCSRLPSRRTILVANRLSPGLETQRIVLHYEQGRENPVPGKFVEERLHVGNHLPTKNAGPVSILLARNAGSKVTRWTPHSKEQEGVYRCEECRSWQTKLR